MQGHLVYAPDFALSFPVQLSSGGLQSLVIAPLSIENRLDADASRARTVVESQARERLMVIGRAIGDVGETVAHAHLLPAQGRGAHAHARRPQRHAAAIHRLRAARLTR